MGVLARLQDSSEDDTNIIIVEQEMASVLRLKEELVQFSFKDLLNEKMPVKNSRPLVLCFLIQFW